MDNAINNKIQADVIIPVYKPDEKFNFLLERLVKQSVMPNRIILLKTVEDKEYTQEVDEGLQSQYNTLIDAKNSTCKIEVHNIKKSQFDHGGTRNFGASLSSESVIIFMTQDAVPADSNVIENLLKAFDKDKVSAAYARQLPHKNAGVIESYTRNFNYPRTSYVKSLEDINTYGIKTYFCSNVCAAYKKEVYDALGGFVLKTIFNEDMIMAANMIQRGYAIAYQGDARVFHSHSYTYREQFKRNFDMAVSQEQYKDIFAGVKSENEGIKLVKNSLKYLIEQKKYFYIPDLIFQSGFKYLGYKAGRSYKKLPLQLIRKISLNPSYWN